jgi:hypothetical protein
MDNRKTTPKQLENYKRLKYRRELERFLNRVVSISKDDSILLENFKIKVDGFYNKLIKIDSTTLDNKFFENIEKLVNIIISSIDKISNLDEFIKFKNLVLKEANIIQKEKNRSSYKKDKYKHKAINDGW